jgi:hypothetical protein
MWWRYYFLCREVAEFEHRTGIVLHDARAAMHRLDYREALAVLNFFLDAEAKGEITPLPASRAKVRASLSAERQRWRTANLDYVPDALRGEEARAL